MLGFKGLFSASRHASNLFKSQTNFGLHTVPKYHFTCSTLALNSLQNMIINPNTLSIANLRQLILKSKTASDCPKESIESLINLISLSEVSSIQNIHQIRPQDSFCFYPLKQYRFSKTHHNPNESKPVINTHFKNEARTTDEHKKQKYEENLKYCASSS